MSKKNPTHPTLNVLVVGSLPPPLGGTTILLLNLITHLQDCPEISLRVINTSRGEGVYFKSFLKFIKIFLQIAVNMRKVDIVTLHMNEPLNGLPIWLLSRLFRRSFLIRWFGGTNYREHGSVVRKSVSKWLIKHSDINLFETRALVEMSLDDGSRKSLWYSNSRDLSQYPLQLPTREGSCRKFVYLGHIKREKGILEIIEAAKDLPEDVVVDIYGPFVGDLTESIFAGHKHIHYCGVLPPDMVARKLCEYDALLLPTFYPGEGYPGAVIEAYLTGTPVICSDWQALPEIVDTSSGILVPPRDSESLRKAMVNLVENFHQYSRLREGAWQKREFFSSAQWSEKFVQICKELNGSGDT
ncbi:MAG: glycosyltransferase family 4 protein [Desulfuromonadales bacterium]|nr:glycosyltransferase family 4 protein [Desulfuromonadales bacterium]